MRQQSCGGRCRGINGSPARAQLERPTFCSCKRTLPGLPVPAGGVHSNTSRMLRVLSMQCARFGCSNVNTSWGRGPCGQG